MTKVQATFVVLATLLVAAGCGGGGDASSYPPDSGWDGGGGTGGLSLNTGYDVSEFRSVDDFRRNPAVQHLLQVGDLEIYRENSPPDVEGYYEANGRVDYHEARPDLVGARIRAQLHFYGQTSTRVSVHQPTPDGDSWAEGWFITGSGSSFSIAYVVVTYWDYDGGTCEQTDAGILMGRRLSNGELEMKIGIVHLGLKGACVQALRDAGENPDAWVGMAQVNSAVATPRSAFGPLPAGFAPTMQSLPLPLDGSRD